VVALQHVFDTTIEPFDPLPGRRLRAIAERDTASDLCRLIGHASYKARVIDVIRQFGCQRFSSILAVHGRAVLAGEISR
jgi:hypothetical protein